PAREAAFLAKVGRHALEGHDRASAGLFGDTGLVGVGDVHDDAAFEHFGQADFYPPLVGAFCTVAAAVYFLCVHRTSPLADPIAAFAAKIETPLTPAARLRRRA